MFMALLEGDLWVDGGQREGARFRVRIWQKRTWREHAYWSRYDLREHCDNDGLIRVEERPRLSFYSGIYRREANVSKMS
jgi:hypothetical protein